MAIWVDADACPNVIKEILFRAAERTQTPLTLVANQPLRVPPSRFMADDFVIRHVKTLLNPQGADETRRRHAQRLVRHQRQRSLGPLCRAEQNLFNQ